MRRFLCNSDTLFKVIICFQYREKSISEKKELCGFDAMPSICNILHCYWIDFVQFILLNYVSYIYMQAQGLSPKIWLGLSAQITFHDQSRY